MKLINDISENLKNYDGRINVRPSGTEPLIRIMVESKSEKQTKQASTELLNFAKKLIWSEIFNSKLENELRWS